MRTIQIAGTSYPVLFDVNVIAKVQERYQSVDALPEKMQSITESIWIITQLINEADRYQRIFEGGGTLDQPMTEEKLGMLLTADDLFRNSELAQVIIDAFNEGLGGRKNPPAGQSKKPHSGKRKRKKKPSTLPGSNTLP